MSSARRGRKRGGALHHGKCGPIQPGGPGGAREVDRGKPPALGDGELHQRRTTRVRARSRDSREVTQHLAGIIDDGGVTLLGALACGVAALSGGGGSFVIGRTAARGVPGGVAAVVRVVSGKSALLG